jgi:hypothetical protein
MPVTKYNYNPGLQREAKVHHKPVYPTVLHWEALTLGVILITISVLGFVWMIIH